MSGKTTAEAMQEFHDKLSALGRSLRPMVPRRAVRHAYWIRLVAAFAILGVGVYSLVIGEPLSALVAALFVLAFYFRPRWLFPR